MHFGLGQHLVSEVPAQKPGGGEVHLPTNDGSEFLFHSKEGQAWDVRVAVRPEVVSQDRAEQRQAAHVVPLAELSELAVIDGDPRSHKPSSYQFGRTGRDHFGRTSFANAVRHAITLAEPEAITLAEPTAISLAEPRPISYPGRSRVEAELLLVGHHRTAPPPAVFGLLLG
ncbi:MAG TPA: hypothetical protein VMT17_08775 [Anaeromyxobacteraceae bacterium]|nr:hypothetical protein [Anaeromyxobacteraceae bacterium]